MAAGGEARHCHPGEREGTAGVWQGWGHTARQDRDRTGTSPSPRGEPCAGAQAGTALGHGGLCTPWDPAEAARAPHGWLWSCSPPGHPTLRLGPAPLPQAGRDPWHCPTKPSHPPPQHKHTLEKQHCPSTAPPHPPGPCRTVRHIPPPSFLRKFPLSPCPGLNAVWGSSGLQENPSQLSCAHGIELLFLPFTFPVLYIPPVGPCWGYLHCGLDLHVL